MLAPKCKITYDENNTSSGSLLFEEETHTMGNAIRHAVLRHPEVEFCGYSVPHPAERKMVFRVQATKGTQIVDLMMQGIDEFAQWCDNTESAFEEALKNKK